MDHRGFSKPPQEKMNDSAFSLDKLVNDMDLVRQKLALERMVVIGHSGHSYMALEYAKKYPQYVSQVILIGCGPNHSTASQAEADLYLSDSVCPRRKTVLENALRILPQQIDADPEKRFVTVCLALAARSWYDYNYDATALWQGVSTNMQMFDYVWGKVFADIDITEDLENFNIPVLLALGRYDYLVAPPHSWNPIRSKFQDLTVRIFEKSGHTPPLEQPDLFDSELLSWLTDKTTN